MRHAAGDAAERFEAMRFRKRGFAPAVLANLARQQPQKGGDQREGDGRAPRHQPQGAPHRSEIQVARDGDMHRPIGGGQDPIGDDHRFGFDLGILIDAARRAGARRLCALADRFADRR